MKLQNDLNFSNFIVSESNQIACAACEFIANSYKEAKRDYNPFIIFGNSGLGKTHLLNATGLHIKKKI